MSLNRRNFLGVLTAGAAAWGLPGSGAISPAQTPITEKPAARAARRGDPWIEINTANLAWNFRQIQERVAGKPVMAVVKANAYGHGLAGVARELEKAGAKHFLVAKVDEARELRAAGIRSEILNFGPYSEADAEDLIRHGISQNVYTGEVAVLDRAARRLGKKARVHIKVDTGLGRVGVPYDRALEFIESVASLRGAAIEGVFTTFTEDPEFDPVQLARFREVCCRAAQRGAALGRRHAASSGPILDLPASYAELDMVRPGIMLYGLYPSQRAEKEKKIDLRPVLSLKARVTYVKTLRPGESVSYHRLFIATQPERVASLAVGYSDGFPAALEGKGSVLVAGRRCPILAITSNAVIARLGETQAASGDEAVLIGAQGKEKISTSEVAGLVGSNVYRVVMGMSSLLPRVCV